MCNCCPSLFQTADEIEQYQFKLSKLTTETSEQLIKIDNLNAANAKKVQEKQAVGFQQTEDPFGFGIGSSYSKPQMRTQSVTQPVDNDPFGFGFGSNSNSNKNRFGHDNNQRSQNGYGNSNGIQLI